MGEEMHIANLLRRADWAMRGARVILSGSDSWIAIYACWEAADAVIRAVVASEGKRLRRKLKLSEMVDLVPFENPLKDYLRAIQDLEVYARDYRVQTLFGEKILKPPPQPIIEEYSAKVEAAIRAAAERFKVDVWMFSRTPAGNVGPIR